MIEVYGFFIALLVATTFCFSMSDGKL